MTGTLDDAALRTFLTAGTRTGTLGWVAADGRPLAAPVWFVVVDDLVWFTTGAASAKARAMGRDPRVVLSVDVDAPPYDFVQLQGTVSITDDPARLRQIAAAAGARYMGEEHAEELGRRNGGEGAVAVAIAPHRILSSLDVE